MNIKYNSKKIQKGDTFIALKTNNDGHKYINDAIKNGATKVVAEYGSYPVETLLVDNTKEYLVKYLYENYYQEIKDLKLIGITGTNGKTTTCMLLHNMLNMLGRKTAYIGTNGFYINKFIKELPNTTPEILDIYELLIEAKKEGCEFVCIEASSHGLTQNRLENLKFDYANLLADMGKTQDAINMYKEYIQYKPKDPMAYFNLGLIYQKNSQNQELFLNLWLIFQSNCPMI